MAASGFDVYTACYVRRRMKRLLFLQEEQHFAEKGRQAWAAGSGEEIPASWKYGDEDPKFKSTVAQFIVKEIQWEACGGWESEEILLKSPLLSMAWCIRFLLFLVLHDLLWW